MLLERLKSIVGPAGWTTDAEEFLLCGIKAGGLRGNAIVKLEPAKQVTAGFWHKNITVGVGGESGMVTVP